MAKIDFSQAYIQKRAKVVKLLKGRKLTYSEIKKKIDLSHTETGSIIKDLLSNGEITKEGDLYFSSWEFPYEPLLTSHKIISKEIKRDLAKEKNICVIDPMTIYGLDKTQISESSLKLIEKELNKIYPRILNVRKIIEKDRQRRYIKIFDKKINIIKDKKIKLFILANKEEIFEFICGLNKRTKDVENIKRMFEYHSDKGWFSQEMYSYLYFKKSGLDSFFAELNKLHKEWCKVGGNPFDMKVINNF